MPAGTSIVWDNRDTATHTATAADDAKSFDTEILQPGRKSRPIAFDRRGEFAYICALHPFMKGTVVVR